jgi:metacaspase-1
MTPKGLSLHVGLNNVDIGHYGRIAPLKGCINDAVAMADIAAKQGFESLGLLTDEQATRSAVTGKILEAAQRLQTGDFFFFTYSGHGSNLRDMNGDERTLDALDFLDETWLLYDGMLIDDEAGELWTQFKPGVRIVALMDSCHSGSNVRAGPEEPRIPQKGTWRRKAIPASDAFRVYRDNKAFYDSIIKQPGTADSAQPACGLRLISGCQDNQKSLDGDVNGLFTEHLLNIWSNGTFSGDYAALHQQVKDNIFIVADQTPNFFFTGTPIPGFDQQRPFTI